ncbi:MAG: SpoIIE family protein phosphatase [Holophagales bacterium]|nr:MAG: SpoIIE family protein phosphatase [Holophagales bacterium]
MSANVPPPPRPSSFDRLGHFVREFTDGLRTEDVQRLFKRDAAQAYAVLARDRAVGEEPRNGLKRWLHRAWVLFRGIAFKLSPPRRLLFVLALLFAFFALTAHRVQFGSPEEGIRVVADASPFWMLASVSFLVYLLAVELADRVLVRDELEVARSVQAELLPRGTVEIPGFRVAHGYRTANEVGGDYYDFLPVEGGRIAVVVGDASGHGMAAGLVMALASAAIRTAVELDPSPVAVARTVNHVLARTGGARSFMSLFVGLLDPASGALEYVDAGHPFPLLRRRTGELVELGRGGLPLGLRSTLPLAAEQAVLEDGDVLVFYSDGLPEGVGRDGQAFGFERLRELVALGGTVEAIHARILAAFDTRHGTEAPADDLTLVVMAREAESPSA